MSKKLAIGAGVVIIVIAVILGGVYYKKTRVVMFESHNGVLGVSFYPEARYNYTVYAKVKNVLGVSDPITVYCELTRQDLTTITKHKTFSLHQGESKIVDFFFSNDELKGDTPRRYKVYGGG